MNSKRKADLQRRLTMASVPKPPEGLLDQIKRDIPNPLPIDPRADRDRLSQSIAFNMRVAASILLLVSCAYLMFHLASGYVGEQSRVTMDARSDAKLAKMKEEAAAPAPAMPAPPPAGSAPRMAPPAAASAAAPQATVARPLQGARDVREEAKTAEAAPLDLVPPAPMEKQADARVEGEVEGAVVGGVVTEPAPPPAAPPPPPAVAEAAAAPARPQTQTTRTGLSIVQPAQADTLDLAQPKDVFGISIDRDAFERVKTAIERGERPSAAAVDVEALINYFAGASRRAPRDVQLEVEGSPAPVANNGRRAVLRYTIDTPRQPVAAGASVPPVATDVRVSIEFDTRAVASFRRIGGEAERRASEALLLKNLSVTALYEIELKPNVNVKQTVATVEVRYRRVSDGKEMKRTEILRVSDLSGPWTRASHRHRLASLGAVWGETLRGAAADREMVAERAEELAKQAPKDTRARELAHLSEATTKLLSF